MKITLTDVNDSDCTVTLSESAHGNIVIEFESFRSDNSVIIKPGELFRAARLFIKDETGEQA